MHYREWILERLDTTYGSYKKYQTNVESYNGYVINI